MKTSATCPVCNSSDFMIQDLPSRLLQLPSKFKIGKCKSCELVQLTPRPNIDDYEEHYKESQFYSPEDYNKRARSRIPMFAARLRAIDTFIEKNEDQTIIDFGCAGGHFLKEAEKNGWTPIGIEYTDKLADHAKKLIGKEVYKELSQIKNKIKVDVVHSNHVFEHLPDPLFAAKEINTVLKPNGILFIEVPHQFSSLTDIFKLNLIRLLGDKLAFKIFSEGVDPLHHTFFYRPKTLKNILQKAGFNIVYCSTFNPAYFDKKSSLLGAKRIPYFLLGRVGNLFMRGGSLICVAQKK